MQENNDGDNSRSASGKDDITRDDGSDQNTSATALSSNGAPAAPKMEHEAAILDSDKRNDGAQTVTNIAQSTAATTVVSQDVREALPMDSELSQQQHPEAKPVSDENILNYYDQKGGDVNISEKNATSTMISSVIPPDQMVTDSSSSITATTTSGPLPTEIEAVYVNHGLAAWEMNRQRWLQARPSISTTTNEEKDDGGHGHSHTTTRPEQPQRHAKQINVDEIIDAIFTSHKAMLSTSATNAMNADTGTALSSSSNMTAPFPQSVPLPQMIDILQDLWEAESL